MDEYAMNLETPLSNPYVGPRTFSFEQSHLFFGRERESRDLLARVLSERLLLFYAQSGAGKSSLLHTRLIPQLQEEKGFVVLPVARVSGGLPAGVEEVDNVFAFNLMLSVIEDTDPALLANVTLNDFLARLVRRTVVDDDGRERKCWSYDATQAAGATGARRYALVIDQFEEIITAHPDRWFERESFFRQLDAAMHADPNLWVVLTLREDYLAALDPYAPLLADRLRAQFRMERMGKDAALDAVRQPAELGGHPFAPGVAEKLADDLRQVHVAGQEATVSGQYLEPVQLQVVCYQLWENLAAGSPLGGKEAKDRGEITFDDLAQAGNVDQALTEFYEETLAAALADPAAAGVNERQLRAWFDNELITEADTRGLVRQGAVDTGGLPNDVVRVLQRRFLVRGEARGGDVWIELVHDRFVEPIRQSNGAWFGRNLNPLTLDARAWLDAGKPEHMLYSGSQLAAVAAQVQSNPAEYSEVERTFVDAGQQREIRRTALRQRKISVVYLATSIVFIALAVWALSERAAAINAQNDANENSMIAELQRVTAESASTRAVASAATATAALATAQSASTAAAGALATQEADLIAQLTAVAVAGATTFPQPSVSSTRLEPPSRDTPTGNTVYRVRSGDTLASILSANNLTISEFSRFNPTINLNSLQIGQAIQLPFHQSESTSTPIPTTTSTANPTVVAQQTQLVQVQATQTMLAVASSQENTATPLPVFTATRVPVVTMTPTAVVVRPPVGQIAFASDRSGPANTGNLFVMESNGRNVRQLTFSSGFEPSYSRQRNSIAFTAFPSAGHSSLYAISPNGGNPVPIDEQFWDNWEPSWSPSGSSLVFTSSRQNRDWEIWTMDIGGGNLVQLTSNDPGRNFSPSWSPDGRYIAFFSDRDDPGRQVDIWRMNADGSNQVRLTNGNHRGEFVRAWGLSWSPDSSQIAFPSNRDGNHEIYVMDVNGRNQRNLTRSASDESSPAWSPDGQWIAFIRAIDLNQDIFIITTDGTNATNLTRSPSQDWDPAWLP